MRVDRSGDTPRVVWSASDLKTSSECEFAWMRMLDAKLGRLAIVEEPADSMLERAAKLGDQHEDRWLQKYRADFGEWSGSGGGVASIERVHSADAAAMQTVVDRTVAALGSDADVVFQAAFVDEDFVGFADFLVRDGQQRWVVQDSKLARSAKPTALMQLAAYVDQLDRLGIERSDEVQLLLGSGETSTHEVRDLLPLFEVRRERLRALIADRAPERGVDYAPIAWGDERGDLDVVTCGRCATCGDQVSEHRDLYLVAKLRNNQRSKLRAIGVTTIDELAGAIHAPKGMSASTFETLREQARIQLEEERTGSPVFHVHAPHEINRLPEPDAGDIFFDFEGDPLYTENAQAGETAQSDLQYLFGWVDNADEYTALWAHSFAEEKRELERFLAFVNDRLQQHPNLHIYHYAPYEVTKLRQMTSRYGVGEHALDQLLRDGVFVDLLPVVNRSLRIGKKSYSIKKLEPLYMGDDLRVSDVQNGGDSIISYVRARECADEATPEALAERAELLDDLADYNRYDCVSTRHLRNWLLEQAAAAGAVPQTFEEPAAERFVYEESELGKELARAVTRASDRGSDDTVWRLAHASIEYFRRENKSFWFDHYQRRQTPLNLWEDTKDVLAVDELQSSVQADWGLQGSRSRTRARTITLRGALAPGSTIRAGDEPFALYEGQPWPGPSDDPRAIYAAQQVRVLEVDDDAITIAAPAKNGEVWEALPVALTPAPPPRVASIQAALERWAGGLLATEPLFPFDPASDVLTRRAPHTRSGRGIQHNPGASHIDAIVATVLDLDNSYVAVQGPPGTGKTYAASHVIAELVNKYRLRVGVVAQSHAVVEHLLNRVVQAGVAPAQVAKNARDPEAAMFTNVGKDSLAAFTSGQGGGYVIGGTAWDLTNRKRVGEKSLDLLVIDEAGQFSLASTIAVAQSAHSLLLLGDPQQLPQVSQGTHPAPVDVSALGWLMNGAAVLPDEYGFFLEKSWRMHPQVAEPVSQLAYEGKLESDVSAALRSIDGVTPGVHPRPVRHRDNATESLEEAAVVVEIVSDLIGRDYIDGDMPAWPLEEADFIVITPYNAQCDLVREALAEAGFGNVRVGTVDKFQGQEAAVSITSLAASSGKAAPRGSDFVLLENRLNVAVSRAKVAAYVVYSPALLDELPNSAEGIKRLSAFARLVRPKTERPTPQPSKP